MSYLQLVVWTASVAALLLIAVMGINFVRYARERSHAREVIADLEASIKSDPDAMRAAEFFEEQLASLTIAATTDDPELRTRVDRLYKEVAEKLDLPPDSLLRESDPRPPGPPINELRVPVPVIVGDPLR